MKLFLVALAVVVGFLTGLGLIVLNHTWVPRIIGGEVLATIAVAALWQYGRKAREMRGLAYTVDRSQKVVVLDDVQLGVLTLFLEVAVCGAVGWWLYWQVGPHLFLFMIAQAVLVVLFVVGHKRANQTHRVGMLVAALFTLGATAIAGGLHQVFGHTFDTCPGAEFMINYGLMFGVGFIVVLVAVACSDRKTLEHARL